MNELFGKTANNDQATMVAFRIKDAGRGVRLLRDILLGDRAVILAPASKRSRTILVVAALMRTVKQARASVDLCQSE